MIKVLVVEDDPISRELVFEMLNAQGFVVHGAENGVEAIKKTEKELYYLILMDIELPGMDGIEATRTIKNMPQYKDVPIIALTAYAMKGDKERILEAGLDDYIAKPIDVSDFMKRMEKYINQ
jgi:CheY-like chemotaxis protein